MSVQSADRVRLLPPSFRGAGFQICPKFSRKIKFQAAAEHQSIKPRCVEFSYSFPQPIIIHHAIGTRNKRRSFARYLTTMWRSPFGGWSPEPRPEPWRKNHTPGGMNAALQTRRMYHVRLRDWRDVQTGYKSGYVRRSFLWDRRVVCRADIDVYFCDYVECGRHQGNAQAVMCHPLNGFECPEPSMLLQDSS